MNAQYFEQWLLENAEHFLFYANGRKPVLVIDNAPYHRRRTNNVPKGRKQEMVDFLVERGYHADIVKWLKKDLVEELKRFVDLNPEYNQLAVEQICAGYGIEVTGKNLLNINV
jgi:hypothetical protein